MEFAVGLDALRKVSGRAGLITQQTPAVTSAEKSVGFGTII
jgi:hypothetical protein